MYACMAIINIDNDNRAPVDPPMVFPMATPSHTPSPLPVATPKPPAAAVAAAVYSSPAAAVYTPPVATPMVSPPISHPAVAMPIVTPPAKVVAPVDTRYTHDYLPRASLVVCVINNVIVAAWCNIVVRKRQS